MKALYQTTSFTGVNLIYLLMGTACNMRCRHCLQVPIKRNKSTKVVLDKKVIQLIENYIQWAVHSSDNNFKTKYLVFWGGEPLLYWDFIQTMVVSLTAKYNILQNKNFRFRITTNGSLLTQEKVDFINQYQIKTFFSYDAPYPFAVRDYVSDDICNLVNTIDNAEIECNFSAYNFDKLLAFKCLKAKFPNCKYQINQTLQYTFDLPYDVYNFNWKEVEQAIRKFRIAVHMGNQFASHWYLNRYLMPIALADKNDLPYVRTVKIISILPNGDITIGFNSKQVVSSINRSLSTVLNDIYFARKKLFGASCSYCRNRDVCKPCLFDKKNESNNFCACLFYNIKLYDLMKNEFKKLNFILSKDDIMWYYEQEKIMDKQVQLFLQEGQRYVKEKTRLPLSMMYRMEQI